MPANPAHPNAVRPPDPEEAALAYERIKAELERIPDDLVGRVTADIGAAVSLTLGCMPVLRTLLPEMQELLKKPPLEEIERLPDRALGMLYTELRYVPRSDSSLDVELEEARLIRAQLLASADAHVLYGQMSAEAVAHIRDGKGHLDRAKDLIALAGLFRAAWPTIGKNTQVTAVQVERASQLGTGLVAKLGIKELGALPARGNVTWAQERARAFRLFMFDYEEIRRAVEYVRYHQEDATSYLPVIHRRGSADEETEVVEPIATDATDSDATDTTDTE